MSDSPNKPGALRPRIGGRRGHIAPQRVPTFRAGLLARLQQRFGHAYRATSAALGAGQRARRSAADVGAPGPQARRCVVKARIVQMNARGTAAARLHLDYIMRDRVEADGSKGQVFAREQDGASAELHAAIPSERRQFRFIVSPEDGEIDLRWFTRALMRQVEADLGRKLIWGAVAHHDTDNPHVHLVVRGVDRQEREVRIDRDYIARRMRWRAQELATRELGPRSRAEIGRQRDREVGQERFTMLDRELERRGAPSLAHADQADRLIEQGVSLRVQGRLEEALDVFKRAHALAPSARTLAQMGLAEGALHRWVAAEDHLSAALASHDTPWIEVPRNREALEQALVTVGSHIGTVKVLGASGARVTVDDRELGPLPLASPLRLPEGPVHLKATAPGYGTTEVAITIVAGGEQTVVLPLVPLPSPAPPAAPVHLDEPSPRTRWKTWTGLALLGASAAAIATGAVWVVLDEHPSCPVSATPCKFVYDTKLQGWLTIGAGIAAGTAGGLLLWSGRHPVALAAGPGSLAFLGRF